MNALKVIISLCVATILFQGAVNGQNRVKDSPLDSCSKCVIVSEQKDTVWNIIDLGKNGQKIWSWSHTKSDLNGGKNIWFGNPSDGKIIKNKYLLLTASGGAVGLVRIQDKKLLFLGFAGGNTHSAEILPDGNIVSASSTGNKLTIFNVDTLSAPNKIRKNAIELPYAHNVVWDNKRKKLWASGRDYLYDISYNFNYKDPKIRIEDSIQLPKSNAHDMFPVYGKNNFLWYTNSYDIYRINVKTGKINKISGVKTVKSISSGPPGFSTIIVKPKKKWWTDEIMDINGKSVYNKEGLRIYKARWVLPNKFSYKRDAERQFKWL